MNVNEAAKTPHISIEVSRRSGYLVARDTDNDLILIARAQNGALTHYYLGGTEDAEATNVDFSFQQAIDFTKNNAASKFYIREGDWVLLEQATTEEYPHKCPKCGSPAYISLLTLDCSNNCS